MKPTKLEAAIIMLNMAQTETDNAKRAALLVGIHHTVRRKLQQDRNRFSRARRKHLAANAEALGAIAKGGTAVTKRGTALAVESGTAAKEA